MNAAKNRVLGTASETSDTEAEAAVSGPGLAAMIPIRSRLPSRPLNVSVLVSEGPDGVIYVPGFR
jgi:hypothetical protein